MAFQPSDHVYIGQEPSTIRRTHAERQRTLRHGEAWQSFKKGAGQGWQAVFDEDSGTAHRAWGPGIPLDDASTGEGTADSVMEILSNHPELVGIPLDHLRLGHSSHDAQRNAWFVRIDQVVPGDNQLLDGEDGTLEHFASHGAPVVWRGAVEAWVQHGRLTMLSIDTVPAAASLDTRPTLSAQQAIDGAITQGPAADQVHSVDGAVLVVLPVDHTPYLTWMVRSQTGGGTTGMLPGHWVSFVDANTGELLNVHNQVRYLNGAVYAIHDTRTVDGDTSVSPLVKLEVDGAGTSEFTDDNGDVSITGADSFTALLSGQYFYVRNSDGSEGDVAWSGGDVTWDTEDATIAEIDTYVFLNQIREWASVYAPDIGLTTTRLRSTVNIDDSCNAYYDGNVNFFRKGSGCNNTGRIADVNYHEWGHGLHRSAANSNYLDGSVGEGAGDTLAVLNTGDPVMAPYFMENGSGIREVASNQSYPEDVVGEVHQDGLIFAGAMWDTWHEIDATLGEDAGYDVVARLFVVGLTYNPELSETYDAMVAADDDNGDLSDGTPNQCAILNGFAAHGLGPGGANSVLELGHQVVDNQSPDLPSYELDADVVNLAPQCIDPELSSAEVVYRVDDGGWQRADLEISTDTVAGTIPQAPAGSIVDYYIEAEGSDGTLIRAPLGGTINPTTFVVGELEELYFENFEDDDGGYTHELVLGEDSDGADDWQWGQPDGLGGDPAFAFSGNQAWGNDLGGEWNGQQYNGEYQNDKINRLSSTAIETGDNERVILQFRRWLNVEDGYYDQAIVTIDGEEVWTNHASSQNRGDEHHQDAQWALETVEVPAAALEDGEIVVSWEIHSDSGLTFGGWTMDDVGVYALAASEIDDPDDTPDGETGDRDGVDDENGEVSACACSSGRPIPAGLAALALVGVALIRRRRD